MAGQYTPPGGNNPASSQLQQGNSQQLLAAANYSVANGNPLTPEAVGATQNAYKGANAEVMGLNTSPVRQQYIDNTSYNQVQGNYQDLAQQLAGYDNAILKPQFAGQNPGMPTDLPEGFNPDVTMSGLSMNTPGSANLPAEQGIYNSNPIYGFNAQNAQGNNLVALLQTLNSALGKEYDMGTNKHSADLKSAAATLAGLGDILRMNTDLEMRRLQLSQSSSSKADDDFLTYAEKVKDDLQNGKYSAGDPLEAWGKAYESLKSQFPNRTPQEIDAVLGGRAYKDAKGNWVGEGNASKETLTRLGLNPTQYKNLDVLKGNLGFIDRLSSYYDKSATAGNLLGLPAELASNIPGAKEILSRSDPSAANYLSEKNAFITGLKNLVGESGVLTNQDVARISNLLPGLGADKNYARQRFFIASQDIKRTIARNTRSEIILRDPVSGRGIQAKPDENGVDALLQNGWEIIQY